MKKIVLVVLMVLVLSLSAAPAMAKITFNFQPGFSQSDFKNFSTELGLALSYVPLAPAEPLGGKVLPGFDIGIEATVIKIDKNASFWQNAVAPADRGDIPNSLIFPKFHAQVGLPVVPIDLGYVYAKVPGSDITYMGGEIKWAILRGSTVTPAIAIRGAYTKLSGVDVLDVDTKSLDISISKGFALLTPYAGIGEVWITSKPKNDIDVIGIKKEDITETKGFVGLKLSMGLINIVGEADFAKVNEYSLRLNLHF
jgi:hypothetical protein